MNTHFRESFDQVLAALADVGLLRRVRRVSEQVAGAHGFQQTANLKPLDARGKFHRSRAGA